ncbi:MAG: amidohydrolase family protein, partial [Pseudomonadota bacterium]
MSEVLIKTARLLDPTSGLDEAGDLRISDGAISESGPGLSPLSKGAEIIEANGLCLAPGLVDLRVKTGEPGGEHRETLETASRAAVAGGVTTMAIMPDTDPVIDDVALVEFIARRGAATGLNRIYPTGALTRGLDGAAMAELGLMKDAGALFFSHGDKGLENASLMKRALAYAASLDATLCVRPMDTALAGAGIMNAGPLAARMGLAGVGHDAEVVRGFRDIHLAERAGARLILDQVSTPELIALAAEARSRGADIHCTVAAHSLYFNEIDVGDYLTYCKVMPPFRSEETRLALIEAVVRGDIAAVVSAHDPQPPEEKRLPFGEAEFGAAGLETTLVALLSLVHNGHVTLLDALKPVTIGPATLAGLPVGTLAVGAPADIILFDPGKPWLCNREDLRSRSTNSPFDG